MSRLSAGPGPAVRRWRVLGGVAGPAAFIAAWSVLGATRTGYSPVDEQVSQLAAVGSPSALVMAGGFVALSVGVSLYAAEIGAVLPGGVARAAAATAVGTLAVAAIPLGSALGDRGLHEAAAAVAYLALASTPLLGARSFARQGRRAPAVASAVAGVGCAGALLASAVLSSQVGLWQRVGFTLGDAWIMATAVWMLSGAEVRRSA